jgi:hypothetical protein
MTGGVADFTGSLNGMPSVRILVFIGWVTGAFAPVATRVPRPSDHLEGT